MFSEHGRKKETFFFFLPKGPKRKIRKYATRSCPFQYIYLTHQSASLQTRTFAWGYQFSDTAYISYQLDNIFNILLTKSGAFDLEFSTQQDAFQKNGSRGTGGEEDNPTSASTEVTANYYSKTLGSTMCKCTQKKMTIIPLHLATDEQLCSRR